MFIILQLNYNVIFNNKLYDTTFVKDLMMEAHAVDFNDNLPAILKKFDETRQWNLPVVKNKQYLGFLSKARILTEYRAELMKTI